MLKTDGEYRPTPAAMLPGIAPTDTPILQYWFFHVQVNEIDFLDSVMVLGFSEELNQHLLSVRKLLFPPFSPSSLPCPPSPLLPPYSISFSLPLPLSLQLYQEHCREVRAILSHMNLDLPHYHNLEWRLDVQLASRSLQQQAEPTVTMRLHTTDEG